MQSLNRVWPMFGNMLRSSNELLPDRVLVNLFPIIHFEFKIYPCELTTHASCCIRSSHRALRFNPSPVSIQETLLRSH